MTLYHIAGIIQGIKPSPAHHYTVEPSNKGHFGFVLCSEVVPISEVCYVLIASSFNNVREYIDMHA